LFIDRLLSLVALYCWSSDSQHNPRPRIGVGHSILTNVNQMDLTAPIPSGSTAPKTDQRLWLPLGSTTTEFSNEEAGFLKFCCINQTLISQLQPGNRRERQK